MKKDHNSGGIQAELREKLSRLLRSNQEIITIQSAASTLSIENDEAGALLFHLAKNGWLSRIKRGHYIPVPITSITSQPPLEHPWAIASHLFEPCYIGGWSAGEYWDFTEQIFNTILVLTTKPPRKSEYKINGTSYHLHSIQGSMLFGTKTIWQGQSKVQISDPSKTIIDMFYKPAYGGGIRQLVEFYKNYLESEHKNIKLLIEYALQLNKGVVFKRLGFITEKFFHHEKTLIQAAFENLSAGYSKLDSNLPKDRLLRKWNLWVSNAWLKDMQL